MTLFLLRRYSTPSWDVTESRGSLTLAMSIPLTVMSAWGLPEESFWVAALTSILSAMLVPHRATSYEAALPIPGRAIAVARLISALAIGFLPMLLAATIVAVHAPGKFSYVALLQGLAIVLLANFLPRVVRPREFAVTPADSSYPLILVAAGAVAAIFYLPSGVSLTLILSAAMAAGIIWWHSIPLSYQAAPINADARPSRVITSTNSSQTRTMQWWRLVTWSTFTKNRLFIALFMIFGGATNQWQLFVLTSLSIEDLWQRSRWLRPFPLSHRTRLWLILGPGAIVPMIFVVIGMQIHWPGEDYFQSMNRGAPSTYKQEPHYFNSPTSVSLTYWEKVPDHSVPTIIAPWGETAEPYTLRILGNIYYNPYSARLASSERFTDWQFERLTNAVYGFPISRKVYDAADVKFRRVTQKPRMMILNCSVTLVVLMLYMILSGISKLRWSWRHPTVMSWLSALVVLIPAVAFLVSTVTFLPRQGVGDIFLPLLEKHLLQLSAVLPENNLIVAFIALVPVAVVYALLEWQFARSEVVGAVARIK